MTTYGNSDFTNASIWALDRYHPHMRVVIVDGHPTAPYRHPDCAYVWIPDANAEDCRNAGATLVRTSHMLCMDNDVKVISPDAVPLLCETLTKFPDAAATGWYGIKVKNWKRREAYVGSTFTGHMLLDATQCSFSLHDIDRWRAVGGVPRMPFYPNIPKRLWANRDDVAGVTGDFAICNRYRAYGWTIVSPAKTIPIIHWTHATHWMPGNKGETDFDRWWHTHVHHTRLDLLNECAEGVPK
jgi:hypothetical protein